MNAWGSLLLALAAHAAQGQPVPNLLLAAVHFLLLKGQAEALAQFYPSLTPVASSPNAAYPTFRAFCLAHADAIRHLLATRRVQTNEVGRTRIGIRQGHASCRRTPMAAL